MYVSIDGTDFEILQPSWGTFKDWYSHKFKGAGLRYEIGLNISTGGIVWAFGGFPCGKFPDISIARMQLVHHLKPGEYVVGDDGYRDPVFFIYPASNLLPERTLKEIAQRHETANRLLKMFKVLGNTYRSTLAWHPYCFHAVANLVQLSIQCREMTVYQLLK